MIDYIDIKNLGFKKVKAKDEVYENRYGRKYWWMEFTAGINCPGFTNEIIFNWDCDTREVQVFRNNIRVNKFSDYEEFIKFFEIFQDDNIKYESE